MLAQDDGIHTTGSGECGLQRTHSPVSLWELPWTRRELRYPSPGTTSIQWLVHCGGTKTSFPHLKATSKRFFHSQIILWNRLEALLHLQYCLASLSAQFCYPHFITGTVPESTPHKIAASKSPSQGLWPNIVFHVNIYAVKAEIVFYLFYLWKLENFQILPVVLWLWIANIW